ncbi:type IV secretory system conjugative DNA transfer family protein [Cytobacillus firmus]|uniref:VirD4-like conjugal transfer protein, CD1115 family n=1 Tax=Cytobacillus firmus TaxID=1399 RepID=UPI00237B00C4|nr:type IV secretory system conjugative DNA transfer family protein [Cytobacillus firmus]MDD9309786.1 type IV secretory system conjugative DNA transfer family protein [Cytobacillus firmus]
MKVGKTGFATKSLVVVFLGLMVNYLCGYLVAYSQYITFYKIKGLELITQEFIKEPWVAFKVLILGTDLTKEVFISIHEIYSEPMFHVIFICFYAYFVFSYFSKSKRMEKKDASEYGSHGSARWSTKKEINTLTHDEVGFILGEYKGKKVIHPFGKDENGNDKTPLNQNVASFGGAGTGKTAGYGIPNILHNADVVGESMVITDPKGELYNKTAGYLKEKGYEILYFNLLDMTRSLRYNPLDYVSNTEEALSLANMIISNTEGKNSSGDSMWKNAEMAYFASLMMYLKETMPRELQTVKSVLQLGTRIGSDEDVLDDMFSGLPDDSEALEMYNIFRLAQDKTRAGILIGFGVRLKLWVSKSVANITATSDFDLNQLGKKKTALYLMIPDSDSTFDLLPALMLDQMFNELYKQAGRNDSERLTVDVRCFLDELANIAAINDFERKVSTMRSRGISVVPIFQSITQFKNRYDHDRWSEILASSDTIVFLGTADKMTAKYFSEKLGNTTLLINSLSESTNDRGDSESKSHNVIGRTLMSPDELERMEGDKVIVFQRGRYPMMLDKHFYFKQKKWANLPKLNWYKEIEPRIDPKIKLIDPFAIREAAATVQADVSEEKSNYIAELLEEKGKDAPGSIELHKKELDEKIIEEPIYNETQIELNKEPSFSDDLADAEDVTKNEVSPENQNGETKRKEKEEGFNYLDSLLKDDD